MKMFLDVGDNDSDVFVPVTVSTTNDDRYIYIHFEECPRPDIVLRFYEISINSSYMQVFGFKRIASEDVTLKDKNMFESLVLHLYSAKPK